MRKKSIMRLYSMREKNVTKLFLYKEGMKFAMVYRYSDMNVYQMKMSNCELVKIMHVNIHSFV